MNAKLRLMRFSGEQPLTVYERESVDEIVEIWRMHQHPAHAGCAVLIDADDVWVNSVCLQHSTPTMLHAVSAVFNDLRCNPRNVTHLIMVATRGRDDIPDVCWPCERCVKLIVEQTPHIQVIVPNLFSDYTTITASKLNARLQVERLLLCSSQCNQIDA